jgi:hypothetical protein
MNRNDYLARKTALQTKLDTAMSQEQALKRFHLEFNENSGEIELEGWLTVMFLQAYVECMDDVLKKTDPLAMGIFPVPISTIQDSMQIELLLHGLVHMREGERAKRTECI